MDKITTVPVFHYLYEDAIGKSEAERTSDQEVRIELPYKLANRNFEYLLPVDIRDKRTLVVFDGDVLFGGIPRSGNVIQTKFVDIFDVPIENVRMPKENEKKDHLAYSKSNKRDKIILMTIFRHFLLLPAGRAAVRRYRPKSLSPQYTLIDVKIQNGKPVVTWINSTY